MGLYSGKDGSLIKDWLGEEAGDRMGETVAGAVVGDTAWLLLGTPDAGEGDRGNTAAPRRRAARPTSTPARTAR